MAQAKKAQVIITANASVAKRVMEELDGAAKRAANDMSRLADEGVQIKNRMSQLAAEGKKNTAEYKQLQQQLRENNKAFKAAEKEFQAYNSAIRENVKDTKRVEEVMKNLAGTATRDLRRALQAAKREMEGLASTDPKMKKLQASMKAIQGQIDANTGSLKKQGSALNTTLKNLVSYAGVFAGFNKIKSLIEGVFQSNLKLSDSLADIRKVSGLAMEDINRLYRNIAQIDSRNTIETLNQLAYTGAKLGIGQNYGVEGLTGFVKAAEQVQMALGEDMGEKALPELAKMTEVMGLIEKYGVEQSMQKAASAIFQLGATSTATGTNIVEFAKRLYGLANVSRVSADDLLALGSAADAMGLMPEVAATAFNKLFTSVQKNHNMIEKTLGLQPGLIKGYYEQGKTMEAIVAIFDRMNQTGNLNLLGNVFKDLGSDGARLVNVMATMSDRVDILRKHLETSRDAFKEGEAVIGEYMIQNQTAQALMERASNLWAKAFTNPEGVDMVKQMAQAWYDLSKRMTESEGLMHSLRTSIELIALAIKSIIALSPYLIRFGVIMAGAFGIKSILMGFGALRAAFATFIADVRMASGAMGLFNAAMKSNLLLGVASAVAAVATVLWDYSKAAEESAKREAERQAELKKAFESSKEAVQNVVKPLETYKKVLDQANLTEKQKMEMVKDFNNTYRDYLDYLGIEVKTVDDLRDAYARVVEVMRIKKAYEERESYRQQVNGQNRMERIGAQAKAESEARSLGIEGINKEYLEGTQNKVQGGVRTSMGTMGVMLDLLKKRYGDNVGLSDRGQVYRIETIDKSKPMSANNQRVVNIDVDISGLRDAVNDYITAYRAERQTDQETDKMFDSEFTWTDVDGKKRKLSEFDLDKYNLKVQEARWKRKGSLENDAPDKAAIAAARKAAQEAKQAMRKEMQDAEQNVTGIISKLEEYYRLQEAAIQEARADGELTESQTAEMVRSLNILKNETLSTARRAVTTGDTTLWDKTKQQLQSYMADTSEVSQNLLHEIVDADVQALHTSLAKFNGTKDVYGLSAGAFFDQMNAKAAGNQREAARLRAKLFSEAEKMVQQYHFIDEANKQMQKDLEQMGFITETYEQLVARQQAGITKKPDTVLSMTSRQQQARNEMTDRFNATQGIGTAMPEDMGEWFKKFTDNGQAEWSKTLPELQKWVQNTDKYKDDIQHLYDLLKQLQRGQTVGMDKGQMQTTQKEIDRTVSTHISDQSAFMQMGLKFVGQGTIPYTIDITNQQEALQWLKNFATDGEGELEQWAQAFPQITDMVTRIKAAEKDGTLGETELQSLQDTMPQIEALYMKLINYSDNVGKTIEQQVNAMMPSRAPIGVDEMTQQFNQRRNLTESKWNERIDQANALGGPVDENGDNASAIDLKRQRDQALIDMEYQFQQQLWQIRDQMGTTMFEQYDNELAKYKNMLDKKLISERQFQQKKGQLQMKLGLNVAQQYNDLMSKMVTALKDYEIASVEAKYEAEISAAQSAGQDTTALEEQKEAEIFEIRKKYAGMELAIKISEIIASTAAAVMQAFAQLGPIAGAIAGAMISATGTAQVALAIAEYDKVMSASAGSKKTSTAAAANAPKTKLRSGMLTYDEGNADRVVGSHRRKLYDDGSVQVYDRPDAQSSPSGSKRKAYLGTDGHVYRATAQPALPDGVQLIRRPIATTVNGQPSLVAERGPEIIIGRRATRHIQMNEPGLLHHLAAINGRFRTYDEGTVPEGAPSLSERAGGEASDARVAAALEQNTQMMLAMQQTIAALSQTVTTLQQRGIRSYIQKYGTGGLIDEVKSGLKFDQRYNR